VAGGDGVNPRVLVGMEVHLQLKTRSKMFCRCPVRFGAPPNSLVCPVCLGMPGSLPVPNRDAMILALSLATAMGCEPASLTKFDRKNYFYPDLPKGYQISQFDLPLARGGAVEIVDAEGRSKRIRLRRLHIEEDVGKSFHDADGRTRVDFNRAGTPLVEIVTEPDIASPEEARAYLQALRALVRYLDVSEGNMQEGNLRCEPNVNLHIDDGTAILKTPIVEVKNLNSVGNVERALRREIERQLEEYRRHGADVEKLPRSTRGYDDARDATFLMRAKEEAHDYRYFPEPDIPPIHVGAAWLRQASDRVPELPLARMRRFEESFQLTAYDAEGLVRERAVADWFEEATRCGAPPKAAANWILGDLARIANDRRCGVEELGLDPRRFAALVLLVEGGKIARAAAAREVLPRLLGTTEEPEALVASLGLATVDDRSLLRDAARRALEANPKAAEDVRAGKEKALGPLMGFVMRETGGKASPAAVRAILLEVVKE